MRNRNTRRIAVSSPAFTLIEILVVVAIIALLISILLPSLAAARRTSRTVACRANVHQMGLALTMYTNQYGYYPGHHLPPGSETAKEFIVWPTRLMRAMKASGGTSGQHKVFWCPDSKYKTHWDGRQRIYASATASGYRETDCVNFDYGYNDWGVSETHSVPGAPNLGLGGHIVVKPPEKTWEGKDGEVRVDKVKRPAEMICIADNDADDYLTGTPGQWDTAIDPVDDPPNREWPGARHDKGCNVLWADGHADFQLQAKLVEKTHLARRRWNNDYRAHCDLWGDGAGHKKDSSCARENKYSR